MSRILGAGLTVVAPVSVLAPARAGAQTAAGLSGPPSEWRLQLGVGGTWYENPRFSPADEDASSWSTRGNVSLSNSGHFRSGSYSISGNAGRLYYPDIDALGQWVYGGGGSLSLSGRSTSFSVSQRYTRSNTRHLAESEEEEALPLPTTGVSSFSSGLGLGHNLSRLYQLQASASFSFRDYDDPLLVGGERLGAGLSLGRPVGDDASVSLSYRVGQSWYQDISRRTHQAGLGWSKRVSPSIAFSLQGGVAYLEDVDQVYPAGSASLSVSGRKTSFSVAYSRDFGLAFGYGRQMIRDGVSARLSHEATRRLNLSAVYSFGYRRDPEDDDFEVWSQVASAGFSWDVGAGFGFSARYVLELNDTQGFSEVRGSRATAVLTYGVGWR